MGVHQRQTQRVGNVLLRQRKRQAFGRHGAEQRSGALVQQHQQHGHALFGAAPAHRQQVVIHHRLFVRGQPGHVVAQGRRLAVQDPQRVALERAQPDIGERFHAVRGLFGHFLLQADEVTWQQEVEDLSPPVAERLEAKGPAREQRVQGHVGLALGNQNLAGLAPQLGAAQRFDECQLLGLRALEQSQRAQRACGARD